MFSPCLPENATCSTRHSARTLPATHTLSSCRTLTTRARKFKNASISRKKGQFHFAAFAQGRNPNISVSPVGSTRIPYEFTPDCHNPFVHLGLRFWPFFCPSLASHQAGTPGLGFWPKFTIDAAFFHGPNFIIPPGIKAISPSRDAYPGTFHSQNHLP